VLFVGCSSGASRGVGPPTTTALPKQYTTTTPPSAPPSTTAPIGTGSCATPPVHARVRPPKLTGVVGSWGGGSTDTAVHWDPSTAADYRVYHSLTSGGPFELAYEVPVQGTTILTPPGTGDIIQDATGRAHFGLSKFSYSESFLGPPNYGDRVFYRVAAVDDAGDEGPRSDVVCAQLPVPGNNAPETGCN
jgi:hypothetical protein